MNWPTEKRNGFSQCELKAHLEIVRNIPFFSMLPDGVLKALAYLSTRETFPTGEYLFRQGENDGKGLYFISGKARLIFMTREAPNRSLPLKVFKAGDFLGAMALIGNIRRIYSLRAESDVVALVLDRDKVLKVLEQSPESMPLIMRRITEQVLQWEVKYLAGLSDQAVADAPGSSGIPASGVTLI